MSTKRKPDTKRIQKEIKALAVIKPNVLHYSFFGDDHHKAIEAQIDVLLNDRDEDYCGSYDNDNTRNSALVARQWLDGEYEDAPDLVSDWKELAFR